MRQGISALPFQSLANGKTTYFPVSLLNNLYVSNGMAAGNSPAECCSQALSEIIERYVKNIIIAEGICLPDVPSARLKKYPKLCSILDTLTAQKLSVRVKDASLGGNSRLSASSSQIQTAAEFLPLLGLIADLKLPLNEHLPSCFRDEIWTSSRTFNHPVTISTRLPILTISKATLSIPTACCHGICLKIKPILILHPGILTAPPNRNFTSYSTLLPRQGWHIYRAEYLHCGMYSCRMLVPGMSEIYPIDDMVWNNKGTGARLRPVPAAAARAEPKRT